MSQTFSRRAFLGASAALAASAAMPRRAFGQGGGLRLTATTRVLDIDGRAASVFGLVDGSGGQGLRLDHGQRFTLDLSNALDVDTIIHWHGQIPPNAQDGVPDLPAPMLRPGEVRAYDFAPLAGTHWMHSHVPAQEMQLLAAPLIVRGAAELAEDRQEVVMFLHDFSFRSPQEVLAEITGGAGHGGHGPQAAAPGAAAMPGMDHAAMGHGGMDMAGGMMGAMPGMAAMGMGAMGPGAMGMAPVGGMAMDLNDHDFDAYLANDRTLGDPEVVRVERGGRIRLRIINASAATSYWIDTGVAGRLIAVDGHDVVPVTGRRFGIAMGQRLDIALDLPRDRAAFPVLALREGARDRTGLILATPQAEVGRIAATGDTEAPAFDVDLAQEGALRAAAPLVERRPDKVETVMLGGAMQPYLWTINGRTWGEHVPLTARSGQRVEIAFHNMSMMGHPMHLHGHAFQVVGIGNRRFAGAVRDTVYVPPMAMVTIALDAGEAARWMLHCHHMPHLSTGMMTEFAVSA